MSGLKGFRYDSDFLPGATDLWANILAHQQYGPVYIVQDAYPAGTGYGNARIAMLDPLIEKKADQLELVLETPEPVTKLWRVRN